MRNWFAAVILVAAMISGAVGVGGFQVPHAYSSTADREIAQRGFAATKQG